MGVLPFAVNGPTVRAANYLGLLKLACALLWFRRYHRLARRR